MSANYWDSTQRKHWQFTKDELASMRQKLEEENADLVQMFPLQQVRHLYIYFNQREILSFFLLSTTPLSFPSLYLCPDAPFPPTSPRSQIHSNIHMQQK